MNLIISKYYGFCYGVANTVEAINEMLNNKKPLYCLGEPAHNKTVINELTNRGLVIIEDINNAKEHIIFRAHGTSKKIYEQANQRNLTVTDLTCPKVLKIHDTAREYEEQNYYIFLIGKKGHPEVIGTESFCGNNSYVIELIEDVERAITSFKSSNITNLLIINQTTFNIDKRQNIVDKITENLKETNIITINTTCNATNLRQKEAVEISKQVDLLIVVGGKKSHNTNELQEITKNNCDVIVIETIKDLDITSTKKYETIGITSGASTSKKIVEEIIEALTNTNK